MSRLPAPRTERRCWSRAGRPNSPSFRSLTATAGGRWPARSSRSAPGRSSGAPSSTAWTTRPGPRGAGLPAPESERFVALVATELMQNRGDKSVWCRLFVSEDDLSRYDISLERLVAECDLHGRFHVASSPRPRWRCLELGDPVEYTTDPADRLHLLAAHTRPALWRIPPYRALRTGAITCMSPRRARDASRSSPRCGRSSSTSAPSCATAARLRRDHRRQVRGVHHRVRRGPARATALPTRVRGLPARGGQAGHRLERRPDDGQTGLPSSRTVLLLRACSLDHGYVTAVQARRSGVRVWAEESVLAATRAPGDGCLGLCAERE